MNIPFAVQKHIGRFDIPMENPAAMGIGKCLRRLERNSGQFTQIIEAASVQPFAFDEFHGIITAFLAASGAVYLDNVRMMKHCDDFGFIFKEYPLFGFGQQGGIQQFHGDPPVQ